MEKLLSVMRELREKCPWDQAQTPKTLTQYAIEEAYEVEAAVQSGVSDDIRDELGDLLLQVVFQAQMHEEQGLFNFQDVVDAITSKLIRRHPHVFQAEQFERLDKDQVTALWQEIKQKEKQGKPQSRLDAIKPGPALVQADEIQKNVAKIGFDFPNIEETHAKLTEELEELKQAILEQDSDAVFEEFGDCLFSLVNVGRKLNVNSESALLATIHKFRQRFSYIEDQAHQCEKNVADMTLEEMDELWNEAKIHLKTSVAHECTQQTLDS